MELKNKYDSYRKIMRVVDSCITTKHIVVCMKIVKNFGKLYNDNDIVQDLFYLIRRKTIALEVGADIN